MTDGNIFETFQYYLQFPFVWYALIVGVLVSFTSSLLGVTLVLKRYSFIGDGLSHVAFGAMSVAMVLKLTNNNILIMPVTVITAILLLRNGRNARIKGDALIAVMSVGSLALGYIVMNVFGTNGNVSADVCTTLFGSFSILTLTFSEMITCVIICAIVTLAYIFLYHRIFAVTFDENFTASTGANVTLYNLLIAVITAVIIVLAMNLVGSLLITALLVLPALAAMRIMRSFKSVVVCSVILSALGSLFGMFFSIVFSLPVGSTIVMLDLVIFIVCYVLGRVMKR